MRAGVWIVVVIGCSKPSQPPAAPPPGDTPRVADVQDAAPMAEPAPPPAPDAKEAQAKAYEYADGIGTCQSDADCELSSWQEGCCLATCEGYAISKVELAKRIKKENCPPPGTKLCPPPAPCPADRRFASGVTCRANRCTTRFETMP
jgi:hypothetical protein